MSKSKKILVLIGI